MIGNRRKLLRLLVMSVLMLLCLGMTAHAASNGWVRKKNKCYYYVKKKPVKGLQKIGKRMYYFDSKGVQKVSWRKIGNDYYCFHSGECAEGYMLTNCTQAAIPIGKDGKAAPATDRAVRKLKVMTKISALMDKIVLKSKKRLSSRRKKLKACYDYLRKKYPYRFVSHFREKDTDYDLWFTEALLKRRYADCHPFAFTFAYLANAIGYKDVIVKSWHTKKYGRQGHSFVLLNGKVYDVSLGRHNKKSYGLFGISEKKYYKKYPIYRTKTKRNISTY